MEAYINTNKLFFEYLNNRRGLRIFSNECERYKKTINYDIDRLIFRMSKKYNICTIMKAFNRLNLLLNIKLYNHLVNKKSNNEKKKMYKKNQFKILKTRIYGANKGVKYNRKYKGEHKRVNSLSYIKKERYGPKYIKEKYFNI